jgi:hypothetical protein
MIIKQERKFSVIALLFAATLHSGQIYAASAVAFNSQDGSWAYAQNENTKADAERKALGALGAGAQIKYSSDSNLGWWSISVLKPNFLGAGNPPVIGVAYGHKTQIQASTEARNSCENQIPAHFKQKGIGCDYNVAYWKERTPGQPSKETAVGCAALAKNPVSFDIVGNAEGIRYIVRAEPRRINIIQVMRDGKRFEESCMVGPDAAITLRDSTDPAYKQLYIKPVNCNKYGDTATLVPDAGTARRVIAVLTEGRRCE